MDTQDLNNEQKRVDYVVKKLGHRLEKTQMEYDQAHNETKRVQQNYGNNTSVNYFEVDDRIETSADLQQQRGLVNTVIQNEAIIKNQLQTYKRLSDSPYFGRIDILDDGEQENEKLYIGTASFVDDDDNFLVYDWRAPISSIYYNGTLGKVNYSTPAGKQSTDLLKKRQFQIKKGHIDNMFDTNETVGDEMLQSALGDQNDETMQNIVATIQSEQNDIIRDTNSDLLVVQGVAGSGKTSAILQRIAFLLYHSRSSLEADQIILFSPNRLFSHYISDVLPSLGERNMRQVTLKEFIDHRFEGLKVQGLFDRYENEVNLDDKLASIRNFKESHEYMQQIYDYAENIDAKNMFFNDLMLDGKVIFDNEVIENIYDSQPKLMKAADKFLSTKNRLIKLLKKRIELEVYKPWVDAKIDQLNSEQYHDFIAGHELGRFQDEDDERYFIAKQIVTEHFRKMYDAIYNGNFFDPYAQYINFMKQAHLNADIKINDWQNNIQNYDNQLEMHKIDLDDAAPILYLRDLLMGGGQNQKMQYLFVDEMQDYSIAQLVYIKHAFPKTKINLIGDSEQALFKEVESPETLLNKLNKAFATKKSRLITLNRSYRSTYQITNFAKALLPNGDKIEPFNRQGPSPEIIIRHSEQAGINSLIKKANKELETEGTVAVITKNLVEAKAVYQHITTKINSTLLADTDRSLPKGVVVMPIYLAKGLEFDSVIAWNISAENYNSKKLIGTLYTIATRSMHHLSLISIGNVSPIIKNANLPVNELNINHQI
ncbi:ATP-dependent DNA helicase [Apilactobacillus micheneri]|uniref:ATP-dependent DNA helicase n=1 Tax=Apilactobacillus micheneri TaxID=1899430 RepID=A0ABY2Z0J7_9LACO|nr:RNA polymerase recycling motor HelD [Apilactobacillus micheneri]TPR23507.1 ATP-dependent DNA helicase [Apilactobacillus micheneri]TPR24849.1 ATP-dependent DNA helicase [Apilactobacillus micheneri]TPR27332.1 ATP-dependent DNA helicase [Apilactobacillus micheneri]TPR28716.1 ATP-dependent DNA helicase [Apilactobacillus micheneri]TPR28774.1 ATP-dependent DNA helicase [Apilactobacillus micheneri]